MATTNISSGAGLRKGIIFALDADGDVAYTTKGANGYEGVDLTGIIDLNLTVPDVTRIQHVGDDTVFAQDFLPPQELPSGSVTTGKLNQVLDTTLSGTDIETVGDLEIDGMFTNKDGSEIDVSAFFLRQALDTDPESSSFGSRRWQAYIYPRARFIPKGNNAIAQGSADVNTYNFVPTKSNEAPWGVEFADGTNGFESAVQLRVVADYPVIPAYFIGDGATVTFNTRFAPVSAAKTRLWVNGTPQAAASVSGKTFTTTGTPADNADIFVLYQTAAAIS